MWLVQQFQVGGQRGFIQWVLFALMAAFWLWMFIDSIRRGEHLWACFIFFFILSAIFYYFFVYRQAAPSSLQGFELPGARNRQRIRELQAQIHHLDKAHHHSQLGDVYFQQGKMVLAEASYRRALERDAEDLDTRSHLGQCLLRQGRAEEARPLLEGVCREDPNHDYGYTQMAYAEAITALGNVPEAIAVWTRINEQHSYVRARVQLAELLIGQGEAQRAKDLLEEVVEEDPHTPAFQRKRDRVWVRRARGLKRRIS